MKEKENLFIQKKNIIPGVGKKERKMAEVLYINQMVILNIQEILSMINLKEKANIFMKMVNITLENGQMIKETVKG